MSASRRHGRAIARRCACAVPLLLAVPAACTSQAGSGASVPPGDERGPDEPPRGRAEGDTRDELEQRLHRLVAEQSDLRTAASGDPAICEDVCSLATSICGVQEKLCSIADEHVGEEDYQSLCREARQECREAQAQCVACVESNASTRASTPAK